jgi:hypothetical protein
MGDDPQAWSSRLEPRDAAPQLDAPAGAGTVRPALGRRRATHPLAIFALTALLLTAYHGLGRDVGAAPGVFRMRASYDTGGPGAIGRTRPTPTTADSSTPLGVPQMAPVSPGPYTFTTPQPDSEEPVRYDPCRSIPYVLNERTMPPGSEPLIRDAVEDVQEITGLHFVYEGTTDELVTGERRFFQPERYGDRWAPVLITWSDPVEIPGLAGDIAGLAGSAPAAPYGDGPAAFVSGLVALDGPQMRAYYSSVSGRLLARGIVRHELGHLVGLDHVEDPAQVMNGSGGTVDYQSGDIAGLVQLGRGPCVTQL